VIHVEVSETIRAAPAKVAGTFRDYRTWPRLFPATIRGVGLVGNERGIEMLEIDHVEGKVINKLRAVSSNLIELEECKNRFDGHFEYRFEPGPEGTRFTIVADITLKGFCKCLESILRPYVRKQIRRFVIDPMKQAMERSL
jgi:Polyketide cyclase / dehydrase and lipid transport